YVVERRLSSLRTRRGDRPARGVLHRLPRDAAGASLGAEARIPLSGTAIRLAGAATRDGGVGHPGAPVRSLHREPRSGREFARRPADAPAHEPGPISRARRAHDVGSADAAALSGTGVRIVGTVSVLRRPQSGPREVGAEGARRVS